MVQKEFRELVFEFAKRVSCLHTVKHVFLFGSVAREEADKRSDIDVCIITNADNRKQISKIALDLEKRHDKNIQLVISRNFSKLDKYFINNLFEEGILLYSKEPLIRLKGMKCKEFVLLSYSLKNLTQNEKMNIKTKHYGYSTEKKAKKRTYKSHFEGLLKKVEGVRIGSGAVLIPVRNTKPVLDLLDAFNIKYTKIKLLKEIA